LAVAVKDSAIALFCAPAAATMSKSLRAVAPLMLTLNTREPDAPKKVSQK
jgi:hypothetical protein